MSKRREPSPDARTVVPGQSVTYHNVPLAKYNDAKPLKIGRVIKAATKPLKIGRVIKAEASKPRKHQRVIRMSLALPVSVELVVGTDDDDPSADSDWEILKASDPNCEVSPRLVSESMHEMDAAALAALAASAKDTE
jgi:hypothetical protein